MVGRVTILNFTMFLSMLSKALFFLLCVFFIVTYSQAYDIYLLKFAITLYYNDLEIQYLKDCKIESLTIYMFL